MTNLETIIKKCIANDAKSQKLLYERYYDYAFRIAFRYIYHYDRVAGIVNESFVKLFRNISSLLSHAEVNTEPRLMACIKKIVINTSIDEWRHNSLTPEKGGMPGHLWEVSVDSQNAEILLYKEMICHLKSLPPSYGLVYNMYVIDGFSHQEIADKLSILVSTSKSNLLKAKSSLQRLIKKQDVFQMYV